MFDIGFWELTLISVIGLVVLGPERLPVAIRTVRSWLTNVRQFSNTVKSELTEELRIQELHADLKKAEQSDMTDLSPEVAESVKALQDAAAMVNEPFKKVDTSALDSMISTSLKTSSSASESDTNNTSINDVKTETNADDLVTNTEQKTPQK
ncbi:MAG: Sec-independent protein translocase protein TatB [Colwellia sp.]